MSDHKPPTRIRVLGAELETGKYLVAKLCELGYDVVLSDKHKLVYPEDRFYNITWSGNDSKIYIFANYTFIVTDKGIEAKDLVLFNKEVSKEDFVNFFIFCWGMERGNRLPYNRNIEVTNDKIKIWKLT